MGGSPNKQCEQGGESVCLLPNCEVTLFKMWLLQSHFKSVFNKQITSLSGTSKPASFLLFLRSRYQTTKTWTHETEKKRKPLGSR